MPPTDPTTYFLQQGLLGIIIVVLAWVIVWQQKRLDKKDEEIKSLYTSIGVVQNERLKDNAQHIMSFVGLGEKLTNANAAIQKTLDSFLTTYLSRKDV